MNQPEFHKFKSTLDVEAKRLNGTGIYTKKRQTEFIASEDENQLWYFGLLRYSPSQIQLIEKPGSQAYLHYRKEVSKTNQGGLSTRSKQPKEVIQYENTTNPQ